MSVDISWDLVTSGPDGEALAESIRAFIHAKFQQIALPRFINSVHVHSFHFGSVCPDIEIKDICDPLPDFYEDDEDDEEDNPQGSRDTRDVADSSHQSASHSDPASKRLETDRLHEQSAAFPTEERHAQSSLKSWPTQHPTMTLGDLHSHHDPLPSPFIRSGTPGIPGGTSNMGYFHFPMGGLPGAHTPLAAVAGGGPFGTHAWLNDQHSRRMGMMGTHIEEHSTKDARDLNPGRHRETGSIASLEVESPLDPASPEKKPRSFLPAEKVSDEISSGILTDREVPPPISVSPNDLQVVARVSYNGDIQMLLTAEVMLDYPMPSFVKIPLKMSITGAAFDGVAIVAYIKRKMHFCFLDPDDAETLVGSSVSPAESQPPNTPGRKNTIGGLLREIRVDTEIGRQESGKQVLKNVGKVERFVLEQVRRIFEDEFVFPSFWTFLV